MVPRVSRAVVQRSAAEQGGGARPAAPEVRRGEDSLASLHAGTKEIPHTHFNTLSAPF